MMDNISYQLYMIHKFNAFKGFLNSFEALNLINFFSQNFSLKNFDSKQFHRRTLS